MTKRKTIKANTCEMCAIQDKLFRSMKIGSFMRECIDDKRTYLIIRLEDKHGDRTNKKPRMQRHMDKKRDD